MRKIIATLCTIALAVSSVAVYGASNNSGDQDGDVVKNPWESLFTETVPTTEELTILPVETTTTKPLEETTTVASVETTTAAETSKQEETTSAAETSKQEETTTAETATNNPEETTTNSVETTIAVETTTQTQTTVEPTTTEQNTTTVAPTTQAQTTKINNPAKVKIEKVNTKKKAAKNVKISLKKIKGVNGYQIAIYKTKKNAKNNKKALVKKFVTKRKVTIQSKKLKNKKNLYIKARAYVLDAKGKKLYGKWSNIKKVKIKK